MVNRKVKRKHGEANNVTGLVPEPHPVDLNKGYKTKWLAPGIGASELIAKTLLLENNLPEDINDYKLLLKNWTILRKYRNKAAHTERLRERDFEQVKRAFQAIVSNDILTQMTSLKSRLKH